MFELKVLVFELLSVDALPSCSVAGCEVAALYHERFDDAVKGRSLKVQRHARLAVALFASAKDTEVFCRLWYDLTNGKSMCKPARFGTRAHTVIVLSNVSLNYSSNDHVETDQFESDSASFAVANGDVEVDTTTLRCRHDVLLCFAGKDSGRTAG